VASPMQTSNHARCFIAFDDPETITNVRCPACARAAIGRVPNRV